MKIQIKDRFNGSLLFETGAETIGQAIAIAVKAKADLRSADLSSADLRSANLSSADLRSADLSSADLSSADLRSADLRYADLSSADLRSASLSSADLRSADLSSADLRSADLSYANLRSADLRSANLRSADLSYANLSSADLSSADLRSATGVKLAIAATRILPEGELVVWKKCRDGVLAKLVIPHDAKRSHAFGRKCRAEFVRVVEVIGAEVGVSKYDPDVIYKAGEVVRPVDGFSDDWMNECDGGIHFFITREEAEAYE